MDALDLAGHDTVARRMLERRVAQECGVSGCDQRLGVLRQLVNQKPAVGVVELGGDVVQQENRLFAALVASDGVLAELEGQGRKAELSA